MTGRHPIALALFLAALPAQSPPQAPPAYPERDILSPFRKCEDIYAPPDQLFRELRAMRDLIEQPGTVTRFDDQGREVCDLPAWQQARQRMQALAIDAGYLAEVLRKSRNADERDLALYGMFWVSNPAHVFNLIAHIPGEPEARARQKAYPRAIVYLKTHAGRRWGDLTDEEKRALNLPEPGSPMAAAAGLTAPPRAEDHLYALNLKPFFQLLDVDSAVDRAQALWFLKEAFLIRRDLAKAWLEPALPRLRELLRSEVRAVREQALGLVAAVAPAALPRPAEASENERVLEWTEAVFRTEFPPIRVVSDGLVVLHPGPERDALVDAGREGLRGEGIGDTVTGKTKAGQFYRGFRVGRIPDAFRALPVQVGMVITAVNGLPIDGGGHLLSVVEQFLQPAAAQQAKASLLFEYVLDGETKALEVRVM